LPFSKCAPYYRVLIRDRRWAEGVERTKNIRYLQNIIIIIIVVVVVVVVVVDVVECSRILLCMLLGTIFVSTPGCHGGVALYQFSKLPMLFT
jgi:hypothetical protein